MTVSQIIDRLIQREGAEYTNDPADRGGPTKYGITLSTLQRTFNPRATAEDVAALTEAQAREIYRLEYVDAPGFGAIMLLTPTVGAELVDSGVLHGPWRAIRWLQVALNALTMRKLTIDGECGPRTVGALSEYLNDRGHEGERVLLAALSAEQGHFLLGLPSADPRQRRFAYGWFLQRVLPAFEATA